MKFFKYSEIIASGLLSLNLASCQNSKIDRIEDFDSPKVVTENNVGIAPKRIEVNPTTEIKLLRSALVAATKDTFTVENGVVSKNNSLASFEKVTNFKCVSTPDSQFDFKCKSQDGKTIFRVQKSLNDGNFGVKILHQQPVPNGIIENNVLLSNYDIGHADTTTQPFENPPQKWTTLSKDCFTGKGINPKIPITFFQIDTFGKNSKTNGWARFNSSSIKDSFTNLEKAITTCKLEK